jgi:ParB/RepB/Spo0J family partition protein
VDRGATKGAPRAVGTGTQTLGGALADPDADGTLSGAAWPSMAKAMRTALAEKLTRIYDMPVPSHVGAFCAQAVAAIGADEALTAAQAALAIQYVQQYLREDLRSETPDRETKTFSARAPDAKAARAAAAGLLEAAGEAGGTHAAPEREIPLAAIADSPYQLREAGDAEPDEDLQGLRDTLLSHGLLQAVVVRPIGDPSRGRYELLAGHRRCAAARLAGWTAIRARIVEADDGQAEEIVVIENLLRKDLSAIEEARGFRAILSRPGAPTQEALAARLGLSQGHISNRLRLLRLPKPFQEAVISGEISAFQARDLVRVADMPAVVEEILDRHKDMKKWHPGSTVADVLSLEEGGINDYIDDGTRPMGGTVYITEIGRACPIFAPTEEQRQKLDIREFPAGRGSKKTEERACNVKLWDELQEAHRAALIARRKQRQDGAGKAGGAPGNGRPLTAAEQKQAAADEKARKAKTREQLARRRKSLLVQRLKHLVAGRVLDPATTDEELIELLSIAALKGWAEGYKARDVDKALTRLKGASVRERAQRLLAECFWNSHDGRPAEIVWENSGQVQRVARILGLDPVAAWKADQLGPLTAAWWGAHEKSELAAIAQTRGLCVSPDTKKSALISWLSARSLPPPPGLALGKKGDRRC